MLVSLIQAGESIAPYIPSAPPIEGTFPGGSVNMFEVLFGAFTIGGIFGEGGALGFLGTLWTAYVVLAYLVSIIFLALYVYASVKKNLFFDLQTQALTDEEKLYDEYYRSAPRNDRLADILNHSASENPNDWKLAIIEADIILDGLLQQRGYAGGTLGERLKGLSTNQLSTLDDAWEAHKTRNRIAHDGADFILTKHLATETISRYQRVFAELGVT